MIVRQRPITLVPIDSEKNWAFTTFEQIHIDRLQKK